MNAYTKALGFLSLPYLLSPILCSQQSLAHLLTQIERGRCSHVAHVQDIALHAIDNPHISLQELNNALDILLCTSKNHDIRFPVLRSQIGTIDRAIHYFLATPGFHLLLRAFIRDICNTTPRLRLWHEIKTALDIEESNTSEKVTAFGIPHNYQGPTLIHLHHIITNQRWLECKTIQWDSLNVEHCKKARNLCRQLLRQQQLVERYNMSQNTHLSYELLCTEQVSPQWQSWLSEHRIAYHVTQSLL